MIIAVDGPTASGKGTIARALAAHYRLPHLDTGLLYRAVGYQVALNGGDPNQPIDALAGTDFPDSLLDNPELRSEATGGLASRVSVHPKVRRALFERQRTFAVQPGGAVLDGQEELLAPLAHDLPYPRLVGLLCRHAFRSRWPGGPAARRYPPPAAWPRAPGARSRPGCPR